MTQRVIPIDSPRFVTPEQLGSVAGPAALFAVERPLALEIGCGIGDFMLQLAQRQPQTNFLAIDIYNKGCLKTCRRLDEAGGDNVRVMRIEARQLLTNHVAPQSLAAVYINCPDPWPKKRHRERRLVNAEFLHRLLYYLRPGGELWFATDFADYAEQVGALLPELPGYRAATGQPVTTELGDYPVSKYMRRFLERDQPIYLLHWRKDEALACAPPPEVGQGFRVRWGRVAHG